MQPRPPNFDRVAHIYHWAEYLTLGPLLKRTREHFLPQLQDRTKALVLGDGDGRFLAKLLQQNSYLYAIAVDTSGTMLHLLRKRGAASQTRLQTIQASALNLPPHPAPDLIVTHFFLDCLTQSELDTLAHRLVANVASGTLWLVSDFSLPAHPVLRPLAALYIRCLYLTFRILTGLRVTQLPDPQAALTGAGFTRLARHERLAGLLYTELWQRQ